MAANLDRRHTKFGAPAPELPGSISPFITSAELAAQFLTADGDATVPMSLMRTQWGYMLGAFSNSTCIEGYGSDGSVKYGFYPNGGSFISHAHAWSTGPVFTAQRRRRPAGQSPRREAGGWRLGE
jgi:hypothetical protein